MVPQLRPFHRIKKEKDFIPSATETLAGIQQYCFHIMGNSGAVLLGGKEVQLASTESHLASFLLL